MDNDNKENKCIKYFVILVALKRGRYRHYIAEPEIFFATQEDAQKIKDKLIKKEAYKPNQLKIQSVWKVKPSNSTDLCKEL
jgi:hypothetical protein